MTEIQVVWADEKAHVHSARCDKWVGSDLEIWEVKDAMEAIAQIWPDHYDYEVIDETLFYPCVKFKMDGVRPKSKLEFDHNEYDDEEIREFLMGRTLHWWNKISGSMEAATLYPANGFHEKTGTRYNKQTKVHYSSEGRRIITFCEVHGGFRSVALDDLVRIA